MLKKLNTIIKIKDLYGLIFPKILILKNPYKIKDLYGGFCSEDYFKKIQLSKLKIGMEDFVPKIIVKKKYNYQN